MIEKNILSIDGIRVHYEVSNSPKAEKTLVFIHGFGGCMRAFDPIIAGLDQEKYKIINIDLRAHGKSERPKTAVQYDLNYFANDITLILNQEKAKNITLIGHCFGGILALNIAINYPKLINSLVLISVSYKAPDLARFIYRYFPLKGFIFFMLKFFPHIYFKNYPSYAKYEKSGDYNAKRISSDIMHTSFKSYMYISREIVSFNFENKLSAIKNHVVLIHGKKDRVFPIEHALAIHKKIKHSKLEIIEKANHLVVLNSIKETSNIIKENLEKSFL